MKLVVSHLETQRTYVTREFYYITKDLISNYGWKHIEISKLWNGSRTLTDNLIEEFGELPAVMLFSEAYEFLQARATDIQRLDCRRCFLADDLHWWDEEMRQMKSISFSLCETILSTYAYAWSTFYPELAGLKKLVWVPHSASPDFMFPYNHIPENSIFLSGAMSEHYPLRQLMMHLHERCAYPIKYYRHPGYDVSYDYDSNEAIGRGYAEKINKHRVAFTDCSTFKYVVAKYFEIPATGALLVAEDAVSAQLKELGFVENANYIPVSKVNLEDRIRYVLDEKNREEVDHIRRRGQELIWQRHKTSDRARQINEVCSA